MLVANLSDTTVYQRKITIPANTGSGATIRSLIEGVSFAGVACIAFRILGTLAEGTEHAAFHVASTGFGAAITGTDYTTHGELVAAGAIYNSFPSTKAADMYVRSTDANTVDVIVQWVG